MLIYRLLRRSALALLCMCALGLPVLAQEETETPPPPVQRVLAWVAAGAGPADAAAGEIGLLDVEGAFAPLVEVPAGANRVRGCGESPTSPDGARYSFFVGRDIGALYVMDGDQPPALLDTVNALTCLGGAAFQYAPAGDLLGYIAFEADATRAEFPDGLLRIVDSALNEVFRYSDVIAFDLIETGAAFVSFFTNARGEADEAAIMLWDGGIEREVATLRPDQGCRFTSASITTLEDGDLLLVMGHRCPGGDPRTSWQVYRVRTAERSAALGAFDYQTGTFAPFARTNNLFGAPGATTALFTVPDGITAHTVGLFAVDSASLETRPVWPDRLTMPSFSGTPNAAPRLSPDGRWLAAVHTAGNNISSAMIFDLLNPQNAPISFSAGSAGNLISDMIFTTASDRLIFIAGAGGTAREVSNSLIALDLPDSAESRIRRGAFAPGVLVSAEGTVVIAGDYQVPADSRQPAYLNLLRIDSVSGAVETLFEGATLVDGVVTDQRFAYPLALR